MAGVKWTADITHHLPGATRYADPVATYSVSRDGDVLEEELTLDDLLQFLDGVMEPWQAHLVWWAAWSRWAPMELHGDADLVFQNLLFHLQL